MLDTTTETGARAERRMREEEISWRRWCVLTTIRSRCPSVWFLWEGETFLVYSQPRRRQGKKLRNIERNPRAGLNLNSNAQGGDVVRVEGMAEIVEDAPPLTEVPEYVEKYRDGIPRIGFDPDSFAGPTPSPSG